MHCAITEYSDHAFIRMKHGLLMGPRVKIVKPSHRIRFWICMIMNVDNVVWHFLHDYVLVLVLVSHSIHAIQQPKRNLNIKIMQCAFARSVCISWNLHDAIVLSYSACAQYVVNVISFEFWWIFWNIWTIYLRISRSLKPTNLSYGLV